MRKRIPKKMLACTLAGMAMLLVSLFMAVNPGLYKALYPPNAPETATETQAAKEAGGVTETAPADGAVIPHDLPKETAVPEVMYTAHFARNEFICDHFDGMCDGFPTEMDPAFMARLEGLRQTLGRPIVITSGVRCAARNAEVGGITNSWHLTGHAADCYCPGMDVVAFGEAAREAGFGVIVYGEEAYCHLEYRE